LFSISYLVKLAISAQHFKGQEVGLVCLLYIYQKIS